ncbi:MAG: hypothetical protein UR93_C0002G0005 [Berkelbacteria bacterium GW2011_GWA2_35_9]|uniref:Gcp-like domain-containing protein n=1 Tax=Berkelbacteria bacterium GW2011_GWA2_35_9 TaxID=1618333 RepID=A0A0G0D772_9BACT|nr:MAG: hypothetical protein UR93_C0002G0005 [Berkelbacteria bacterium GW2011_GWA2_35_9]
MKLLIDTTENNKLIVEKNSKSYKYFNNDKTDQYLKLFKKSKFDEDKKSIKKVEVNTGPGGYTSTRIGVAIANVINNLFLENKKIFKPKYRKGDRGY